MSLAFWSSKPVKIVAIYIKIERNKCHPCLEPADFFVLFISRIRREEGSWNRAVAEQSKVNQAEQEA